MLALGHLRRAVVEAEVEAAAVVVQLVGRVGADFLDLLLLALGRGAGHLAAQVADVEHAVAVAARQGVVDRDDWTGILPL
jgi:hypothetical protein